MSDVISTLTLSSPRCGSSLPLAHIRHRPSIHYHRPPPSPLQLCLHWPAPDSCRTVYKAFYDDTPAHHFAHTTQHQLHPSCRLTIVTPISTSSLVMAITQCEARRVRSSGTSLDTFRNMSEAFNVSPPHRNCRGATEVLHGTYMFSGHPHSGRSPPVPHPATLKSYMFT